MKDLCAECGADLREEVLSIDGKKEPLTEASVPMLHSIPELKVCPELAEKIGKEDEQRLLQDRKLALLVDLDQTIVHTTNDNVPANMKVGTTPAPDKYQSSKFCSDRKVAKLKKQKKKKLENDF